MAQQLFLVGLALSSIWEKAGARDGQRQVAGDKGQWGFVLQGMKPAAAQAAEWWQEAVLIIPPFFCLIMMRLGAEDQELGQSIGLFSGFLLAGGLWDRVLRLLWDPGWGLPSCFSRQFWRG
jgi:hypothetical protein